MRAVFNLLFLNGLELAKSAHTMKLWFICTFLLSSIPAQALTRITIPDASLAHNEDAVTEGHYVLVNVPLPNLPPNQVARPQQMPRPQPAPRPPQAEPSAPAKSRPSVRTTASCMHGDQTQINMCRYFNQWRRSRGLNELTLDSRLNQVAQDYAQILWQSEQQGGALSHDLDGQPSDRIGRAGVALRAVAENIARGQPTIEEVFYAWETSPEHFAAMESSVYQRQGFGWFNGNWVHVFLLE